MTTISELLESIMQQFPGYCGTISLSPGGVYIDPQEPAGLPIGVVVSVDNDKAIIKIDLSEWLGQRENNA